MNYQAQAQLQRTETVGPKYNFTFKELEKPEEIPLSTGSYFNLDRPERMQGSSYSGIVSLQIYLGEPFSRTFSVRINTEHHVYQLQSEVKKVMDSTRLLEEIELQDLEFRYSNQPVALQTRIKDVLTIPHFNRIDVVYSWRKIRQAEPTISEKNAMMTTEAMIPYSSSQNYNTYPTYPELCRLTPHELSNLKNFRVSNEHGEVWFLEGLNVVGLDVDKLVHLQKMDIGIASKDLLADLYGFDKSIRFTFRGVEFKGTSEKEYKTRVLRYLQRLDGKLSFWDLDSKTFSFVVNCNSLY